MLLIIFFRFFFIFLVVFCFCCFVYLTREERGVEIFERLDFRFLCVVAVFTIL